MRFNPLDYPVCFRDPERLTDIEAWHSHIPFAFTLVDMLRPDTIVELGTHKGDSYCAFCQVVDEFKLESKCYAVDTWEGDEHAGFYGEEVFSELQDYHDRKYGRFSRLIRSTFDDALDSFPDHSIDLLHIDGLHRYESVKHDFEKWLPKMSERGVLLLHDTNVRERDFGVWRFWREIKEHYASFEFIHGEGLGLAVVGNEAGETIQRLINLSEGEKQTTAAFFFELGKRITLKRQIVILEGMIEGCRKGDKSLGEITNLKKHVQEQDSQIAALRRAIQEGEARIDILEEELRVVYGSKSWYMTSPLRGCRRLISKILRFLDR